MKTGRVAAAVVALGLAMSVTVPDHDTVGAQQSTGIAAVAKTASATQPAERFAPEIVEYDVFGDSITIGYGVPDHQTWVSWLSFNLRATQPASIDHRFFNHAIAGQAIVTPSFLSVDQENSSLTRHVVNFFADPPDRRRSKNGLSCSLPASTNWCSPSRVLPVKIASQRRCRACATSSAISETSGVPADQIILVPMPPVGVQFAVDYAATADVDMAVHDMIAEVNRRLADVMTVPGYPRLDPNGDGLAGATAFDDVGDEQVSNADGLHLDDLGHELIGRAVRPVLLG